jgi:riboflavin synthase
MFTGLIEAVGSVHVLEPVPDGFRLVLDTELAEQLRAGESVAVNGVCLTAIDVARGQVAFDVGPETTRVTALGSLYAGAPVNLERAMRADARVGGHFVQGHVDATGTITAVRSAAEFVWVTIAYPSAQAAYLIPKGAVAVDGISLTVATLRTDRFDVQIVPFTWTHTNLSARTVGDAVNLEFDMLGKYAVRAAELAAQRPLSSLP